MTRIALLTLALLLTGPRAQATPLKELVRKADMVLRGKSSAGVFTMEVKTKRYQRSFKIVVWDDSHEAGKGSKDRTLVKILGPALWRGHGTLKVGNQLKLFNPRTNHVTVVSHSMLGDSWMGSHFTNDDLVKETRLNRHFNQTLEKTWRGKNETGEAVTFHRVRLTPKPSAPVAWGKIVYELWERGDTVIPTSAAYYRKAGASRPDRVLRFSNLRRLGGRQVPATMKMTVAKKPGEYTSITYSALKFDIKIPSSKFTEQALRR